ncbi:MAG: hypothetical protein VYD64_05885 [Pseudomonadota bacterium]|nr:hypothetical protein [Pseudomonadota bacterium]
MIMFVLQSAILLCAALVLGCIAGALAYRVFARQGAVTDLRSIGAPDARPALASSARAVPTEPSPEAAAPGEPAPEPTDITPPGADGVTPADDLKKIRGIGRQIEIRLHNLGVHQFSQIASWNAAQSREWGRKLAFPGRIEREKWVAQARILARGEETRFSRRVARGEVPSSRRKPRTHS